MKEIFNSYDEKALKEDATSIINQVNSSYIILRDEYGLTHKECLGVIDGDNSRTETLINYFRDNSNNKFGTVKEYREKAYKAEQQMFCETRMFEFDPVSCNWICEKRSLVRPVNFTIYVQKYFAYAEINCRDYIEYDKQNDNFTYDWER